MVYINTLMIQQVLAEQSPASRLTKDDLRALTPLIYGLINPYGFFLLEMRVRVPIQTAYRSAAQDYLAHGGSNVRYALMIGISVGMTTYEYHCLYTITFDALSGKMDT